MNEKSLNLNTLTILKYSVTNIQVIFNIFVCFRHAGYYYCGSCGGHAYSQVDPSKV